MQRNALSVRRCLVTLLACLGAATVHAEAPAPDSATANYETRFMAMMIDHHAMAVMMAGMCVEQAIHPALTTMCSDIVANQSAEIETLQSWLEDWYGTPHEPEVNMASMKHLATLQGADFETMFMRMMIRHHARAIREAARCVERAYHTDLYSMCDEMAEAQLEEVRSLRQWLCEWYGQCRANFGGSLTSSKE